MPGLGLGLNRCIVTAQNEQYWVSNSIRLVNCLYKENKLEREGEQGAELYIHSTGHVPCMPKARSTPSGALGRDTRCLKSV
jgi:hypothetical protein